MTPLHSTLIGEQGPLVVFCHGLFGQGKNWTTVAKALRPQYRSLLLDMPNHGRSPRDEIVDYDRMADAVIAELEERHADDLPATLVGHSMGGKIVMRIALRRPELVRRLVVVDMAPADTSHVGDNTNLIHAMRAVDLGTLGSRQDADRILATDVPDDTVRHFLMQNLRHGRDGSWSWQMNLDALGAQHPVLLGWQPIDGTFTGPTLWVVGANSRYVLTRETQHMRQLFPRVVKIKIKGAGHWVHSEQPEAFIATLREFLERTEQA